MVLAVAGLIAKPAIAIATNLINPTKAYEAKMDQIWVKGALDAVANHRRVGTPPTVWNGVVASAPKGFAAYLPGDIWNPLPVTAPAGNVIPGNTKQGPRTGTEDDWVNHPENHASFPYPSASASAADEVRGSPAAPLLAGAGGNSIVWILAIVALVLFTRAKK